MQFLDSHGGVFGKIVSQSVNIYGAVSMLYNLDVIGVGVNAAMGVVSAFLEQQNRIEENNYAGDTADSRLMMVMNEGKWYPAVLKDRVKGEGLLDDSNSINVAYGRPEDLRFYYENGTYRAHFINQKNAQFRMSDDEWAGEKSGLEYGEKEDLLKIFILFTI